MGGGAIVKSSSEAARDRQALAGLGRKMMRCNHLLAFPFPFSATAPLLANAASISAWAGAGASFSRHPKASQNRRLRESFLSRSSSGFRRPTPPPLNLAARKRSSIQRRRCPLAASEGLDCGSDGGGDIISTVGESLLRDLVQPHLNSLSPTSSNDNTNGTGGNNIPTLVLVLAVSGGCDSVALFHAVLSLMKSEERCKPDDSVHRERGITNDHPNNTLSCLYLGTRDGDEDDFRIPCELHVAHFNHEQRGGSSDGDEAFVRNLCQENGVSFRCFSWSEDNLPPREESASMHCFQGESDGMAQTDGNFTQNVARIWRRRKLKQLLSRLVLAQNNSGETPESGEIFQRRWGAILTAHHRDDADETILLKLLRGSHLTNLMSMDATSDGFDLRTMQTMEKACDIASGTASHTAIGYFAKPMLNIRKNAIVEHLTSNALEWREDESNSSSKYKRNKIRNELMPLLSEIAGGDHALQKRLSNLEQQSRDIATDLTKRTAEYLRTIPSGSEFLLPNNSGTQFNVVHEEALHRWITKKTNGELKLPYEQMMRIRDQIHNYPDNLQWTLDVGKLWKVKRNGASLAVSKIGDGQGHATATPSPENLPWTIVRSETVGSSNVRHRESVIDTQELHFGPLPLNATQSLKIVRVKDCGNIKFTPPWRNGRSPIKIKEFLRGQKVPLHCRDEAMILCLSDDSPSCALAVYLEGIGRDESDEWILDADFCPRDYLPVTKIVLQKTSLT